jgi:hypothetical protein
VHALDRPGNARAGASLCVIVDHSAPTSPTGLQGDFDAVRTRPSSIGRAAGIRSFPTARRGRASTATSGASVRRTARSPSGNRSPLASPRSSTARSVTRMSYRSARSTKSATYRRSRRAS